MNRKEPLQTQIRALNYNQKTNGNKRALRIGALFVIQTKGDDSVGLIKKRRKKKEVALWMKSMDKNICLSSREAEDGVWEWSLQVGFRATALTFLR